MGWIDVEFDVEPDFRFNGAEGARASRRSAAITMDRINFENVLLLFSKNRKIPFI